MVDSLFAELGKSESDTQRIILRAQIGEQVPILRIGYWDSLRIDAAKFEMKRIEAQSINNMGYVYDDEGNIPKAIEYYQEGLKRREALGDRYGIAESLNNLSINYERQGDIPNALDYQFRALKIQEEIGDSSGISRSLLNIAHIYEDQDETGKALEYYSNSLDIAQSIGDLTLVGTVLNNYGLIMRMEGSALPYGREIHYMPLQLRNLHRHWRSSKKPGTTRALQQFTRILE
ncbi:MAG TPA: tetratricopeptide repeat protein [Bacteroidales bacterium]|nr:tetratricopeptide repeat protein [Bacteroidales bacterium]